MIARRLAGWITLSLTTLCTWQPAGPATAFAPLEAARSRVAMLRDASLGTDRATADAAADALRREDQASLQG